MPDPTPHVENSKVDGGDRINPVITDITKGGQDNSRIWHTKENDQFFEYRQKSCSKKTANLNKSLNKTSLIIFSLNDFIRNICIYLQ